MFGGRASKIDTSVFLLIKRWFLDTVTRRTWLSPFYAKYRHFSIRARSESLEQQICWCYVFRNRVRQVPRAIFCPSRMSIRNIFLGQTKICYRFFRIIRRVRQNWEHPEYSKFKNILFLVNISTKYRDFCLFSKHLFHEELKVFIDWIMVSTSYR